ncbi:2-phytyl-1,4-naphtoquinone methyltransferase-like [Oculina patagonica]
MANLLSDNAAQGYREISLSVQKVEGEMFVQTDICPQAGDAILDLGCGTGELSAYLAELVGPEGKVVGVDPDKERILLARQAHGEIKNLSFVEGSASNFPGIGSESYDIIFSNHVIHWIPDKQEVFKNMFGSLKRGGKIAVQYVDHSFPFEVRAFESFNPENLQRFLDMVHEEERAKVEQYCTSAGFDILKSYDVSSTQMVFESIECLMKYLWSITHGVFDLKLVTEKRLQSYSYLDPYSSRDSNPRFDFRGIEEESGMCRLIAVKQGKNASP